MALAIVAAMAMAAKHFGKRLNLTREEDNGATQRGCLAYSYRFGCSIMDELDRDAPPCSTSILRGMLADLTMAVNRSGIQAYVTSGSLLGLLRNRDIIPWTGDVDFFAPAEDFWRLQQILTRDPLMSQKYHFYHENHASINFHVYKLQACIRKDYAPFQRWKHFKTTRDLSDFPFAEFFLAKEDNGSVCNGGGCWYRRDWIYPLVKMPIANTAQFAWVPRNPAALMNGNYGPEYMQPSALKEAFGSFADGDFCPGYPVGHRLGDPKADTAARLRALAHAQAQARDGADKSAKPKAKSHANSASQPAPKAKASKAEAKPKSKAAPKNHGQR